MKPVLRITIAGLLAALAAPISGAEIAIQNTQSLAFGSFASGSGGSVSISPDGGRSAGGDVVLLRGGEGQAAKFTVSGDVSATYSIQLPGNGFVKLSGPGADMPVNDFVSSPSGAGGQLGLAGSQELAVGATLTVGAGQAAGSYSGSFAVTVNYN